MSTPLVDFFNIDRVKANGDWEGNSNNIYASSCANQLNLEPQQLTFTPNTVPVYMWFKDNTFGLEGDVSIQAFINYLSQIIVELGYPLSKISYKINKDDMLQVEIVLNNEQTITFTGLS